MTKSTNRLQRYFSVRFRKLLSGAPDGNPPWLDVIAGGDDSGLFVPTDAPWVVHRDFGTLVGGIRALLVQALHPGTLTGVAEHSRYEQDPLGRLAGTIRWLTVTTFGGAAAIATEANRVNRLHDRVTGEYTTAQSETRSYRARDADLLLWVHIAFMESFLVSHERYCAAPIPAGDAPTGADNYVAQWARSVAPLGLDTTPTSRAEMDELIDQFVSTGTLTVREDTRRVVSFIRRPPLPVLARPVYRILFEAAVVSLRPEYREMLGLRSAPEWLVTPIVRGTLRAIRLAIGPESPIEDGALNRLRRIGVI